MFKFILFSSLFSVMDDTTQGQVPQQGSWGFNPHVYFTHPLGVNDVFADINTERKLVDAVVKNNGNIWEVDLCKCN